MDDDVTVGKFYATFLIQDYFRVRVWLWHRATLVEDGDVCLSEDLENLVTKLLVGLVDVALGEDVEGGAHQSEESRIEVDRPVRVQGHVHRDQALASHTMGTELSKTKRRRYFPEKGDHVDVLDEPFGIG